MMEEEDLTPRRQKRAPTHEIGQPLEDLSVAEIDLRIDVLRTEIQRLEQARQSKDAMRAGAEALFKL